MTDILLGSPVVWAGHPGVYVVIEKTDHTALMRAWGVANAPMLHTMLSELTPMSEDAAMERLQAEAHR